MFQIGCLPIADPFTGINCVPSSEYVVNRLFPHGGIFFLTDDVITSHSLHALATILKFVHYNKDKKPEQQNWRLVGRPGLIKWLRQLAWERRDKDIIQMYAELEPLPSSTNSSKYADAPLGLPLTQPPLVISLEPEDLPVLDEMRESDPDAATNFVVEWYAGWLIGQIEVARKFYIVHSSAESVLAKEWKNKYQHLDVLAADIFARGMWSDLKIDKEVEKRLEAEAEAKKEPEAKANNKAAEPRED